MEEICCIIDGLTYESHFDLDRNGTLLSNDDAAFGRFKSFISNLLKHHLHEMQFLVTYEKMFLCVRYETVVVHNNSSLLRAVQYFKNGSMKFTVSVIKANTLRG